MAAALDGLRILDLTQYESGTACTQALAWLGAEVVKIERPGTGDPGRAIAGDFQFEDSEYFLYWNANKKSVALALDQEAGRDLLFQLVPRFDVFIENFGPGVVEKLGLEYEQVRAVHDTVIYASIKGYGSTGPYAQYKCFDMVAQAAAGAFSVTGDPEGPPMRPGPTTGGLWHRRADGACDHGCVGAAHAHRKGPTDRDFDARGDDLLHAHGDRDGLCLWHQGRAAHGQRLWTSGKPLCHQALRAE